MKKQLIELRERLQEDLHMLLQNDFELTSKVCQLVVLHINDLIKQLDKKANHD